MGAPKHTLPYLRAVVADPDFAGLLRQWDVAMEAQGRSARTRATYRYEITRFYVDFVALDAALSLVTLTPDEAAAYVVALPARGTKRGDATRALKAFFSWAEGRIRTGDPTESLKVPRPRAPRAPDISDADLRRLLRAAFHHNRRWGWAIMLCLATGARVSSLEAVLPEDVHPDYIWFRFAKGSKPYEVPLSRAGHIAAEHLRDEHLPTLLGVSAAAFRTWVVKAAAEAGIESRVWPHLLRHAALTRVARVTDPATVAELANWSDLSQYPRYVAVDEGRKRDALGAVFKTGTG